MPPPVGTLGWEQAGGPPLSVAQRVGLLAGSAVVLTSHFAGRWFATGRPAKAGWAAIAPPDTPAARDAEALLREVSSPAMVNHSLRTYAFSALLAHRGASALRPDLEVLFVAAALHDVALFDPAPPAHERCFTVGGARRARDLGRRAGWDAGRLDRMALAITSNLNPFVSAARFGSEAHWMSAGGRVEVFAEQWKVHPDDLAVVLERYPRDGFAKDALVHVDQERRRHPGCRFACLHPLFPWMVRRSHFRSEAK